MRKGTSSRNPSQRPPRPKRRTRFAFLLPWIVAIAATLVAIITEIHEMSNLTRTIWFLCGAVGIAAIFYFQRNLRLDWLSPSVVYAVIFWAFHFGLVFPAAVVPSLLNPFPKWARDWLGTPETQKAVLLSLLFLFLFLLGFLIKRRGRISDQKPKALPKSANAPELLLGGWICIAVGSVMAAVALSLFGIRFFLEAYEVFFNINDAFSHSVVVLSFGLMLQVAGGRPMRSVLITAALCYLPVAIPTFIAGARTAPLFSLSVLLVVLAKRGLRIPRLGLFVAGLFILGLIAVVNETRKLGLLEAVQSSDLTQAADPLAGLIELGGSLRPVSAVVTEINLLGEKYSYGYTYIYPVFRQFQSLMGMERAEEYGNPAFVASYINLRYGSIGFSTVAEAFSNGGIVGVILFGFIWGAILRLLDRKSNSPYGLAMLSVVLLPMMINIRNSFIYVPAWIFLGMFVVGFCRFFLSSRKRHR